MAGTIFQSLTVNGDKLSDAPKEILLSWVGDASDGSVPALLINGFPGWWITKVVTNPGAVAPTAAYDVTGIDVDGADIFNGELLNRSASATETLIPLNFIQIGANGFTLAIGNQSVVSATGTIRLVLNK